MLQMSSMLGGGSPASRFPRMGAGDFGGAANLTTPNLTPSLNNPGQTQGTTDATNTQTTTGSPPPNPFLDPARMQQLMGALGSHGGAGPGGGLFGVPSTPALTDTRPPEERFQPQLQVSIPLMLAHTFANDALDHYQQLNDMGFFNASQNIRALQATGGNVNAAVEYILGGGGL